MTENMVWLGHCPEEIVAGHLWPQLLITNQHAFFSAYWHKQKGHQLRMPIKQAENKRTKLNVCSRGHIRNAIRHNSCDASQCVCWGQLWRELPWICSPSPVTTISFHNRDADMIHEPDALMWCWCAGQMKSLQSTNIGFCALQVTVAKELLHTAELEIGLTVAKSTQYTPPQPLSLETMLDNTHIILHTRSINTYTHSSLPLSFLFSLHFPSSPS